MFIKLMWIYSIYSNYALAAVAEIQALYNMSFPHFGVPPNTLRCNFAAFHNHREVCPQNMLSKTLSWIVFSNPCPTCANPKVLSPLVGFPVKVI